MKTVKSKLSRVVADFLRDKYRGNVRIHDGKSVLTMELPLAIVFGESSSPISPGEEIDECVIRITVMHDAESCAPEQAEEDAAEVFAALADEAELIAYAEEAGVVVSTAKASEDRMEFVEMRWQHVQTLDAIAALID